MPVFVDRKTKRLFIQFRLKGVLYKERLPAHVTRKEAERLEIRVKNQMLFERHGVDEPKANPTFERFIQDIYLPYVEANNSKRWFDMAMTICKFSLKYLKGRTLRTIKAADIETIKSARKTLPTIHGKQRSASTIVKEMAILSKIFSMAVKNDACDYNVVSRVEMPRIDNIQNKVLLGADEAKFLAAFESDWGRDIAELVLHTGLSQADVLQLTKFEVFLETETIVFTRKKTKRRVEVPLNARAMQIIEQRMKLPGSLLFPSPKTGGVGTQTKTGFKNACRRAGIAAVTIRDLRRTFGTRLHEGGWDDMTVASLLGHGDLRSVHRYKRGTEIKRTAVKSLENKTNDANIVPMEKQRKQK